MRISSRHSTAAIVAFSLFVACIMFVSCLAMRPPKEVPVAVIPPTVDEVSVLADTLNVPADQREEFTIALAGFTQAFIQKAYDEQIVPRLEGKKPPVTVSQTALGGVIAFVISVVQWVMRDASRAKAFTRVARAVWQDEPPKAPFDAKGRVKQVV